MFGSQSSLRENASFREGKTTTQSSTSGQVKRQAFAGLQSNVNFAGGSKPLQSVGISSRTRSKGQGLSSDVENLHLNPEKNHKVNAADINLPPSFHSRSLITSRLSAFSQLSTNFNESVFLTSESDFKVDKLPSASSSRTRSVPPSATFEIYCDEILETTTNINPLVSEIDTSDALDALSGF